MSTFDQLLAVANTALGTKYVWGGNNLKGGVDCSGFTKQVYAAIGIELPRVSNMQARAGQAVSQDQAQPGDLVWWDLNGRNQGADHIGIYLGNGKVIEASSSQGKVVIRNLWGQPNFTRPNGAPPQGFTSEGGGPPQPLPAATVNLLDYLVDPTDPGETEATVGAYNFARMTLERMQSVDEAAAPPAETEVDEPLDVTPDPVVTTQALEDQLGGGALEPVSQVQDFRAEEGL